jgi:hypothetical protein
MAGCGMTRKACGLIGGRRILRNTRGRFKPKQPRNSIGRYAAYPKSRKATRKANRK